ncbi:MAG: general secretion pathway protein GspB [Gammaproteobacteria bacterium]
MSEATAGLPGPRPLLRRAALIVAAVSVLGASGIAAAAPTTALDDPTRPPGYTSTGRGGAVQRPRWVLSQTLISPGRRRAIVNGRSVSEGDWIHGAVVVEILPTEVKLRRRDRTFSIKLLPGRVKRPAR